MELTLTGASLSADTVPTSNRSSADNIEPSNNASKNNSNSNSVKAAHGKACQDSCQNPHNAPTSTGQSLPQAVHQHQHQHQHNACCAHKPPQQQDFSQLENIPIERLMASRTNELFTAIIGVIRHGPFETFRYLADAVLKQEKEKGSALEWGDKVELKDTLSSSLLHRTNEGHTLAHWAAKRGDDVRFLEYLAKLSSAILHTPSTDKVGMYPIHWAATEGSIPISALIFQYSNSSSNTSSHTINITNAHHTNRDPSDPVNSRDNSDCTPLLIAAQYGHADLAAFLIKRGADPNAVDQSGDTALHWAAYKGAVPVCGLLLHLNGITDHFDVQDSFGQTPFHLASLRGNVDVVQYLMDQLEMYVERNVDGRDVDDEKGTNHINMDNAANTASASLSKPGYFSTKPVDQYPRLILLCPDKAGKTPLDLAIKKKKIACEVVLKEYMEHHCNPSLSLFGKARQYIKPFCSVTNWKTWIGITPDVGHVKKSPRLVFWFVLFNLNLAILVELFIYVPLSFRHGIAGRLHDSAYLPLHILTIFFLTATYASIILVNRTDPGVLSVTGFTASNAAPTSHYGGRGILAALTGILHNLGNTVCGLGGATRESSMICANENGRIKREMQNLTRELRNQYEETLERFATEDGLGKEGASDVAPPSLCHSCHIAKPLRSKHCRIINKCVVLFDHHCPFVGTTIGLYNYRYFYSFVFCMTVAEIFFGITGICYLRHGRQDDGGGGREYKIIFLALYLSLFGLLSSGLCIYHTQLINKDLTTNEHTNLHRFKYLTYDPATRTVSNPFDKGFVRNFLGRLKPWKGSYMLAYCNLDQRGEMENDIDFNQKKKGIELKRDEEETKDLMLNVV